MKAKVFLDTNILIYAYSEDEKLKLKIALENRCTILFSEDMQDRQGIENTLTIVNPFRT